MSAQPDRGGAGRRGYDEQGAAVVPLRDYLEQQIKAQHTDLSGRIAASHTELAGEIAGLRMEMASAQAQATKEHAQVQAHLTEVGTTLRKLTDGELRDEGAARLRRTIWKAAFAIIGAMGSMAAVVAVVLTH